MRSALLALAVLAGCAAPRPAPPPFPGALRITRVELSGCVQLGCDALRGRLDSRGGAWFDPAIWNDDLRRLRRVYEAEGYYDARVVDHGEEVEAAGVTLRASVREGAPTRLRELRIEGVDGLPPSVREDALSSLALHEGERFREPTWNASKDALLASLREHGYAAPELRSEARVDPERHVAGALLRLTPGRRYRFGEVELTGELPDPIRAAVIAAVQSDAGPDAWFRPSALADAQRRVFGLGGFEAVAVRAGPPDAAAGRVPVLVSVIPGPELLLRVGAGVGFSTDRSDAHALAELRLPRALGGLRLLDLRARAGWAVVPGALALATGSSLVPTRGAPVALGALDLVQPGILGLERLDLFTGVEGELGLFPAYRLLGARPRIGLSWSASSSVQLQVAYDFRVERVFDTRLLPDLSAGPSAYGCASPCTLSSIQLLARWDTHRPEEPRRGERALLRLRQSGGLLGGGHRFSDVRADVAMDRSWGRDGLALRLAGGGLFDAERGAIPVNERLSGGGSEMRGFGPGHLSPELIVPLPHGGVAALPVGGRGLLQASAEVNHALGEKLAVAVFADAGSVSIEAFDAFRLLGALQYAVGAGVRYRTPLGPLHVDLAYRLPFGPALPTTALPGAPDTVRTPGCFGIGGGSPGTPESACSVHISIGEAW